MNYYSDQLQKLKNSSTPLPEIKFKDSAGNSTAWMHLTVECICAIEYYFSCMKNKEEITNN